MGIMIPLLWDVGKGLDATMVAFTNTQSSPCRTAHHDIPPADMIATCFPLKVFAFILRSSPHIVRVPYVVGNTHYIGVSKRDPLWKPRSSLLPAGLSSGKNGGEGTPKSPRPPLLVSFPCNITGLPFVC